MKFPEQRLLWCFTLIDTALRELPGVVPPDATRPQNLPRALSIGKDNANVRPETVSIYHAFTISHPISRPGHLKRTAVS